MAKRGVILKKKKKKCTASRSSELPRPKHPRIFSMRKKTSLWQRFNELNSLPRRSWWDKSQKFYLPESCWASPKFNKCNPGLKKADLFCFQPESNLVCPICGKSFKRPQSLCCHSFVHSGQLPFVCDFQDVRVEAASRTFRETFERNRKEESYDADY